MHLKRDNDLLLSANNQLEQLYSQLHEPCLALHISRNYRLLQEQNVNSGNQKSWQEKETLWWKLYRLGRSNNMSILSVSEKIVFS